jgi:hypothetical protein
MFGLTKQGGSGVGMGNFEEIGPLDTYLKPRNSTWLQVADLLFVVILIHYLYLFFSGFLSYLTYSLRGLFRIIQLAQDTVLWKRVMQTCLSKLMTRQQVI